MASSFKVLVTEPIPESALKPLYDVADVTIGKRGQFSTEEALIDEIEPYHGIVSVLSNPLSDRVMEAAPNLKVIGNMAVGYNNIDTNTAEKRSIVVGNTPDVLTESTADLSVGLVISVVRKMKQAEFDLRDDKFDGWEPTGWMGMELNGAKLGIVGMGRIGQAFARRMKSFGVKIGYHNRSPLSVDVEKKLAASYYENLSDLLRTSDIISFHCPLTDATRHLLNRDNIKLLKSSAYVINTSRGPVIEEEALAEALHRGDISGAGIDVFEEEPSVHPRLLTAPNTVLLPHIGSATVTTRTKMAELAVDVVVQTLSGHKEELNNRVV